jgi:hypothetical protein
MSRDLSADTKPYSKKFSHNLILCLATILVLVGTAELVSRALYHPPNLGTVIHFDRNLGWALEPKTRLKSVDHQRSLNYNIRTNSLGMREREFTLDKKSGTRRILFIGDSVTFGTGVDARWRFSDFTGRELVYFERVAGILQPDVVILTLTVANDVVNNALDHLFLGTAPKPHFVIDGDSLILVNNVQDRPERRESVKTILRRSRFLLFVKRRLDRQRHRPVAESFPSVPRGFGRGKTRSGYSHWSVFEKTYEPELESAWRVTEAILSRFADLCKKSNTDLIILGFPLKMEVDKGWRRRILAHVGLDSTIFDFDKPYQRLSAYCANNSMEFYYPLEEFKDAFQHRDLYFERDGHPNKYGHALAARIILRRLREEHGLEFEIAESDRAYLGEF